MRPRSGPSAAASVSPSSGLRAQASVVSAGRRASAIRRTRARGASGRAALSSAVAGSGQSRTSCRRMPRRRSNRARPNCGWPSSVSTADQLSSSRWRSSPGRTTRPSGSPATVASRSAVAGMLPVEPAAITGWSGAACAQRRSSRSSSRLRRAAGSIAPFSSRTAGQFAVTIFRNSRVCCQCADSSAGASSARRSKDSRSVWAWSSSRASAWASSTACSAEASRSRSRMSRASISCRFSSGIAGGVSNSASSSGGRSSPAESARSSSSTSPIGRILGSSRGAPPLSRRKASRRVRQARRVGSRTRTGARLSGAPPNRSNRPRARAVTKSRWGGMV